MSWKHENDPPKKLNIAIDWDETFTADPDTWRAVVSTLQAAGHTVYVVTARSPATTWECEQGLPGCQVVACSWELKREVCRKRGIKIDIWIDDSPEFI